MLHEQRVKGYPVRRVDHLPERGFGLLGGPRPDHAEPVRDPVHVGVDRDRRDAVPEHEHAVRGLRPDARERREEVERAGDLALETVEDRPGARADDPGLHPVEPGRTDQRLEAPRARPGERWRVGVAREEPGARDVGVRVPGPLREDRADQHLERILGVVPQVRGPPVPGAVERRQPVQDLLPVGRTEARRGIHGSGLARGPERARPGAEFASSVVRSRPGSERSGSSSPFLLRMSSPMR